MLRDKETFEKAAKTFHARGSNQLKNSAFQYRVCDERWKADVCQRLYVMVAKNMLRNSTVARSRSPAVIAGNDGLNVVILALLLFTLS